MMQAIVPQAGRGEHDGEAGMWAGGPHWGKGRFAAAGESHRGKGVALGEGLAIATPIR